MAFGDTVQSASGTNTSGNASATLASGATAGNLLIFAVGRAVTHGIGGSWGTPTGFTDLPNSGVNNGNLAGGGWYKIATGGETTVSSNGTSEQGNWCAALVELEGPFDASPLDQIAEDEANLATVVTSQPSGTTGTTAQADELAIAYFAADNGSNVDGGGTRNYSNSFTEVLFANSGARASAHVAKRVLSATGTFSCTFSVTDTGDEMYGAIATFKKQAAAGGGTFTRIAGERFGLAGGKGLAA